MKELVLFVDGQTVGPFPLEDVEKRLAAGEFSAETPCAEPGATEWKTLGEVVPASGARPTVVRLARKTKEETEEMKSATSEKLDPDVRKKLLLYNLADSISVDKFTPLQADTAIKIHEAALKKGKNLKIAAGVGGFLISFALASFLFTGVNFGKDPGGKGQKLFEKIFEEPPNPEHKKKRQRIAAESERLAQLREEIAAVNFVAPRSQGDPRQTFLGNVEIKNPDISTVTGTLDVSALPASLVSSTKFEVIQLKRLDGTTEDRIKKQNELFAVLSTPVWTDAELRKAIADELAEDFPKSDAPEAAEIANRLKMFRLDAIDAQVQWLEKRIGEIAQLKEVQGRAKEKSNSRKKSTAKDESAEQRKAASRAVQNWASREMPKFIEKLKKFLAEKEIYYSAEKRAEAWREFSENELPAIQNTVAENETQRTPVGGNGEFLLEGRSDRNLIAVAHFERAGDVYFVPAKDENEQGLVRMQNVSVDRRTLKPEDVLMDERYIVSAKEKTGGKPMITSGKILSQEIFIVRTSPEWFYITVEKKPAEGETVSRRRPSVVLGVPAEFFESVAVGDEVPMEKLLTFERFGKAAESPATGRLIPIPDDKLEIVKEQQTAAGIAFPPPPEKYVPPAPKKEEPAEAPAEESPEASVEAENVAASDDVPENSADAPEGGEGESSVSEE
ncbi:MAG: DUF4339 domain-containing protein [Opitutales bacterium]|nr:DUF4339 domain-containing protein [Opitutales bacterium]